MTTDYRAFNLIITCAEGAAGVLSFVNFFWKTKVYAEVSIVGNPASIHLSPLANYFGHCPVWNFLVRFYLEESKLQEGALTVRIQLHRKRIFREDEAIGEAFVPIRELLSSHENVMDEHCSMSWIKSPSGGRRALVYYSYYFSRTYRATATTDGNGVVAPPSAWLRDRSTARLDS